MIRHQPEVGGISSILIGKQHYKSTFLLNDIYVRNVIIIVIWISKGKDVNTVFNSEELTIDNGNKFKGHPNEHLKALKSDPLTIFWQLLENLLSERENLFSINGL